MDRPTDAADPRLIPDPARPRPETIATSGSVCGTLLREPLPAISAENYRRRHIRPAIACRLALMGAGSDNRYRPANSQREVGTSAGTAAGPSRCAGCAESGMTGRPAGCLTGEAGSSGRRNDAAGLIDIAQSNRAAMVSGEDMFQQGGFGQRPRIQLAAVGEVSPVRFLGVMVLVRAGAWCVPIVS